MGCNFATTNEPHLGPAVRNTSSNDICGICNVHELIGGYIREISSQFVYNTSTYTIPSSINDLLSAYYFKPSHSHFILFTHDADPKWKENHRKYGRSSDEQPCEASIRLYHPRGSKQSIQLLNTQNEATTVPVIQHGINCCFIPQTQRLPPCFDDQLSMKKRNRYSLLFRFHRDIECIAFDMHTSSKNIVGHLAYMDRPTNAVELFRLQGQSRMIYNEFRHSILFAGGNNFKPYCHDIGEFMLDTGTLSWIGHTTSSRQVWPNLCMIDDHKLFICGGRTHVCMTDSLCGCSVNSSAELLDLNKQNEEENRNMCSPLKPMNVEREGHGCMYSGELQKVIVCGGADHGQRSMEIYDIHKDEWTSIANQSKHAYRFANVLTLRDDPFVVNVCGHDEATDVYDPSSAPHCELIDVRDHRQTWYDARKLHCMLSTETNFLHIVS